MNRARLGALGLAAVLSPTLLTGCGFVDGFNEGLNEAVNTVEVCNDSIDHYNTMTTALEKAANDLTAATDKATALPKFNTDVAAAFGALHKGLQEQVGKAKAAEVKKALKELDDQAAALEAKPETMTSDATLESKLDTLEKNLSTACDAARESDAPKK
jgi:prophage DNA circulation protein